MALEDYLPFDPDSNQSDTQGDVDDIFNAIGATSWRDVFHDILDDANPDYIRGTRYSTPEEALFDLYDRHMLGFADIVYYPADDLYGIYVRDSQ